MAIKAYSLRIYVTFDAGPTDTHEKIYRALAESAHHLAKKKLFAAGLEGEAINWNAGIDDITPIPRKETTE